jgi:hypothetical protein
VPEYVSGSFDLLRLEHDLHDSTDPECLWCNGFMSEWWREVNQDDQPD